MEYQTGTGVSVLTLSAVTGFEYDGSRVKLTSAPTKECAHYWLRENDILITRSNTHGLVGHVALYDGTPEKAICCDLIMKMQVDPTKADRRYVYYCLRSPEARRYLSGRAQGASPTMKKIGKAVVQDFPIPLPILEEQQRIVAVLDEAFAGIATAKANTEKNFQNAREVFKSHLQYVFAEAWQSYNLVTLSELATDITDGDHLPPPKAETGVPFITIGNINKDTRKIDFSDTFMVPRGYLHGLKANRKPKKGDVLFTVTGSFGIPVLVKDDVEFCFQRHIGLVRPKPSVDSAWLNYLLLSPQVFKQANDGATGTAQKTVSLGALRSFIVPRVPPSQQRNAVTKLDGLASESRRLEIIYKQKLCALDELRQSLLHRAFIGDL